MLCGQGFGDRESIQLGLSATGGTISAAGLILGLTFLALVLTSEPGLQTDGRTDIVPVQEVLCCLLFHQLEVRFNRGAANDESARLCVRV